MIKNLKQLAVTKAERDKFAKAVDDLDRGLELQGESDPIAVAYLAMMRADCDRLDRQIADYHEAANGSFEAATLARMDAIGDDLIKARIAAKLTQEKLGQLVDCKPQQIQRYERSGYRSASLATLQKVASILAKSLVSAKAGNRERNAA